MEAVKQGGASLGLRSGSHVVLAVLKRAPNEMSDPQKKVFKLDSNMGIAIAGLMADARSLAKYMRTECLNHKWVPVAWRYICVVLLFVCGYVANQSQSLCLRRPISVLEDLLHVKRSTSAGYYPKPRRRQT